MDEIKLKPCPFCGGEDGWHQFYCKSGELYKTFFESDSETTAKRNGQEQEKPDAQHDPISSPSHYVEGREYEPRKVIEDWGLGFCLGNALKYISRAGRKGDAVEDLQKAKQYIDYEIERLEDDK